MIDIPAVIKTINDNGVMGVLVLVVAALVYFIEKRTVPKLAYEKQSEDLDQMRNEMYQLVGPALDRLTTLQEKQLTLQEEMWRRLEVHSTALNELSHDVKLISHELNMRRIEGPTTE